MKNPKTTTFSGGHGNQGANKNYVVGKLSKTMKDVRERFFSKTIDDPEKVKLTPIQKRQNSGGA